MSVSQLLPAVGIEVGPLATGWPHFSQMSLLKAIWPSVYGR
jgi:hypothetical protein